VKGVIDVSCFVRYSYLVTGGHWRKERSDSKLPERKGRARLLYLGFRWSRHELRQE
jgi:hypothetical protein